ncbi:MAG TPA: FIST N-terminal domain-containing protein [Elusimicrobiota bacterium]|jgi:class 3 adenylate cyclase|nr:FIST N-terminal domain-containing protein [Elusimicrobiota bacterium]
MRLGIGLGRDPDATKAALDAVRQAKKSCPRPTLAVAFGSVHCDQKKVHAALCRELDPAILTGGSSYAEITTAGVTKGSVAVLLLELDGVRPRFAGAAVDGGPKAAGEALARGLGGGPASGTLPLGLLFSSIGNGYDNDALKVLGTCLGRFPLFGGLLCGDYDLGMSHPKFWDNWQYSGPKLTRKAARLALLELPRDDYRVAFGFEHGWEPVGPEVRLTKCKGPKVFEVDGMPVIDYYRQFVGADHSGDFFQILIQRFAFAMQLEGDYAGSSLIKLPVAVDCDEGSITYFPAEDLQGRRVRLILARRRGLVEGARRAAQRCKEALGGRKPSLLLVVSCCSRNRILHSRMELEVDAIRDVFGPDVPVFGFYSGGEIVPFLSRYQDVVDPAKLFSGSHYHATTIGMMALAAPESPKRVATPRCGACAPATNERLRELLDRSEAVLDDSESFLANLSKKSYDDGEKLRRQTEVIHRYTPHDVWRKIGSNAQRGSYELADAEFKGAFLFMDVKGFTSFSENHAPAEVVSALNAIFAPATELVYSCGGDVDKYIGDCLFAAFPKPARAVEAARGLLELVARRAAEGSPFNVRIGVNSGRAVRANVGSTGRREYTYIGDAVNTAQRLESNCSPGKVLVCAGLEKEARRRFAALERREIAAKGKSVLLTAFECSL